MWRTSALLLMGFYTGAHANDQAEPSLYLTQRGTKKQIVVQSTVNNALISPCAVTTWPVWPPVPFLRNETCGAERRAESRRDFVCVWAESSLHCRSETRKQGGGRAVKAALSIRASRRGRVRRNGASLIRSSPLTQHSAKPRQSFHRAKVRKV